MHNPQTSKYKAKAISTSKDVPVGAILLTVAVLYVALCLKVFSGF
jgi:hypothetical protein